MKYGLSVAWVEEWLYRAALVQKEQKLPKYKAHSGDGALGWFEKACIANLLNRRESIDGVHNSFLYVIKDEDRAATLLPMLISIAVSNSSLTDEEIHHFDEESIESLVILSGDLNELRAFVGNLVPKVKLLCVEFLDKIHPYVVSEKYKDYLEKLANLLRVQK